jgi:hypothetical protein
MTIVATAMTLVITTEVVRASNSPISRTRPARNPNESNVFIVSDVTEMSLEYEYRVNDSFPICRVKGLADVTFIEFFPTPCAVNRMGMDGVATKAAIVVGEVHRNVVVSLIHNACYFGCGAPAKVSPSAGQERV